MTRQRTQEEIELEKLLGPPSKGGAVTGPMAAPEEVKLDDTAMQAELKDPRFKNPTAQAMKVGIPTGIGLGLTSGPVGGGVGGILAAEGARQLALRQNREAGATHPDLVGSDELDIQILDSIVSMLTDALGMFFGGTGGKGAARSMVTKGAGQRMKDFEAAGVKPSAGDVSQNRFLQGIEFMDARLLTSQRAMREFRQGQVKALQQNFTEMVENAHVTGRSTVGQRTPVEVGQETLNRLTSRPSDPAYEASYFKGFKETNKRARDIMAQSIDARAKVVPAETMRFFEENKALYDTPEMRAFLAPKVTSGGQDFVGAILAEAKSKGGLTWEKFDKLHQHIGAMLDNSFGLPGEQAAALDAVYKVMREDMKRTANAMGGNAMEAWNKYDAFYTSAKAIEKDLVDIIQSNDPEKIFRAADSVKRLQALQTALTPGQFNDFRAAKIFDMGKWNPDVAHEAGETFKVSTWTRNYHAMHERSPEFIDTLYGKRGTPMRDAADRLARVTSYMKDAEDVANRSGTGFMNIVGEVLGGHIPAVGAGGALISQAGGNPLMMAGGVASIAAPGVLPWASGLLMRNPRYVRWLAEAETFHARDFGGIMAHLGRLPALGFSDDISKRAAQTIHDTLSTQVKRQQSLMKNVREDDTPNKEAAKLNKQILMMSDHLASVARDPSLNDSDRRKRMEPVENQLKRFEARRNQLMAGPS